MAGVLRRDDEIRRWLAREADDNGFSTVAIASAKAVPGRADKLNAYLGSNYHGTMSWMAETAARRASPKALWPEAETVIMLAMNYGPAEDPLAGLQRPAHGGISVYARNRDYHDLIKGRLKTIAGRLAARTDARVKIFVDTAPVMEKPLAEASGIGWQGKHTNLVSREHGSWLFLGSIFTTLALVPDDPGTDHCGQCRACLDICPTNAFPNAYQIDARRCISYLTIEHKGPVPHEFRKAIGNRIYGCDDCLAVCPWNKFASATAEIKLTARQDLIAPKLADLLELDDAAFRSFFSGSPVKRIGRDRFIRNCLIAAGNSGDSTLQNRCHILLGDPSSLVRGAAVWALSQLMDADAFAALRKNAVSVETDHTVLREWAAVQNGKRETGQ